MNEEKKATSDMRSYELSNRQAVRGNVHPTHTAPTSTVLISRVLRNIKRLKARKRFQKNCYQILLGKKCVTHDRTATLLKPYVGCTI